MQKIQRISSNNIEIIELITTASIKNTLIQAAQLMEMTVTEFVLSTAFDSASEVIQKQQPLKLTNDERDKLFSLLEAMPKPNKKLQAAMQKYQSKIFI